MANQEDFNAAGEEIDSLTKEGFFGEEARLLLSKREKMSTAEYLYESIKIWVDDDSEKGLAKDLLEKLILFLAEGLKVDPQGTIDLLNYYWQGDKEGKQIEGLSPYIEFASSFNHTKNVLTQLKPSGNSVAIRKQVAVSVANTYSKGVEFIGKTLVSIVAIAKLTKGENFNLYQLSKMTTFEKITLFNDLTDNRYKALTQVANRYLRNAEAHLSLRYDVSKNEFIFKKRENGKFVNDSITLQKMLMELFPSVGAYAQAFNYAGMLIVLKYEDQSLFEKAARKIYS